MVAGVTREAGHAHSAGIPGSTFYAKPIVTD